MGNEKRPKPGSKKGANVSNKTPVIITRFGFKSTKEFLLACLVALLALPYLQLMIIGMGCLV